MVSIIIPCYNAGKLISETLENVIQQTYSNWECLIIDDGSTDNSKDVVDVYLRKDSRFLYFFQPNKGPSVARNYGIENARGEYFQFLDSDDKLESKKLQRQVELMENNKECALVYGDSSYFNSDQKIPGSLTVMAHPNWQRKVSGNGENVLETLLQGNIMVVHSPLIRKTVFDKVGLFDPDIWFNEDWDVWLRCAVNNLLFIYDDAPDTKALIRVHESNRSKDLFAMYLNGLMVCMKINKLLTNSRFLKILKKRILTHINFLEKNIYKSYATYKNVAIGKAEKLYSVTQLERHKKYVELLRRDSSFSIAFYHKMMEVRNSFNTFFYVG